LAERSQALLMLALSRSGRRSEALAVYDRTRRRLSEELGIEPGDRLQRLHGAVLEDAQADGALDALHAPAARRRGLALLCAGAVLLVAAAASAALVVARDGSGGDATLSGIAGNHVGLVDPGTGRIVGQFAAGSTPSSVAGGEGALFVVNAADSTI